jgi:AIPR protein/Abortive infection phage resistance protein N-terminal domain
MSDREAVELERFHSDLVQEVLARADAKEGGALREDELTQVFVEYLAESGEIEDAEISYHSARGLKANAYYVSDEGDRLDLFVTEPRLSSSLENVTKTEVDTAFRRLRAFLERSLEQYHAGLEEASDGFDMAWAIWSARNSLVAVRLFLVTDGLTKIEVIEDFTIGNFEVSHHVWDIRRLYRAAESGAGHSPIRVDFEELAGSPLDCLPMPVTSDLYRCFLAVIPAELIVNLYLKFGPRLLERNVRSFLQLRGNVNKGIRETIKDEPGMFGAYNNGLSIVVNGVQGSEAAGGRFRITSTDDFQVVNGGQTTGSIYRAAVKDKFNVSAVYVPVKITEIRSLEDIDEVAPKISLYANSQNKVNLADFSSNHPFHVRLQELSRETWAPPQKNMQKQTKWFFERARGQYLDLKSRQGTPAAQKAWELQFPRRQMFSKTDLAKFENTWSQLPHIVSRGAQKNFLFFMDQLEKRGGIDVDEMYFQRLVAKVILFRETERIVSRQKYGGYRAQIVTYTLAVLSHATAQRIDLGRLWQDQMLSDELAECIRDLSVIVHKHIMAAPGGQNISEWCKREACWEKLKGQKVEVSPGVAGTLLAKAPDGPRKAVHTLEVPTKDEEALIEEMATVPAETWFGMAAWAKETRNLQSWQRGLAYSLGKLASQGRKPSRKQAIQGKKIFDEAGRLGFAPGDP